MGFLSRQGQGGLVGSDLPPAWLAGTPVSRPLGLVSAMRRALRYSRL